MNTLSTMTLSQRVVNTIAFAQAASTTFAMAQMLGRRKGQLKMPRLDAYGERSLPTHRSPSMRS